MTFPTRSAGSARGLFLLLLPILMLVLPACGRKAKPEPLRGETSVIHAIHPYPGGALSSSRWNAPR